MPHAVFKVTDIVLKAKSLCLSGFKLEWVTDYILITMSLYKTRYSEENEIGGDKALGVGFLDSLIRFLKGTDIFEEA